MAIIPASALKEAFLEFFETNLKNTSKESLDALDDEILQGAAFLANMALATRVHKNRHCESKPKQSTTQMRKNAQILA